MALVLAMAIMGGLGARDALGRRGGSVRQKAAVVRRCAPRSPSCIDESEGAEGEWAAYLRSVYGEAVPAAARHSLTWFYRCAPNRTLRISCEHVPRSAPLRALLPRVVKLWHSPLLGEAFYGDRVHTDGLYLAGLYGFFVRREANRSAAPDGAWIEVLRARKADEASFNSTWYYVVRGSGVWLNVGRTASAEIGARIKHHRLQVAQARREGYETLQFANAWDVGVHELVDLRPGARQDLHGLTTCGAAPLRAGWRHGRECACVEGPELINCAGGRGAWDGASSRGRAAADSQRVYDKN